MIKILALAFLSYAAWRWFDGGDDDDDGMPLLAEEPRPEEFDRAVSWA